MEEEKPTSLGRLGVRVVGTVVGLVLLYVLSFGPVYHLAIRVPTIRPAFKVVYGPLAVVMDRIGASRFYFRYLDFWADFSL